MIEATYTTSAGPLANGLDQFTFAGTAKDSANNPITSGITVTLKTKLMVAQMQNLPVLLSILLPNSTLVSVER